ncbi:MAG: hypothetical protein RBU30_13365 [Polyangia bacterium]|jgi:hypothetical protein|nr:hypothetical protein [Polyangia bacterium]
MSFIATVLGLILTAWLPPDTLETEHFRFHYVQEARDEALGLARRAEEIRQRIVADLGRDPGGMIAVVVVARREEFQRAQPEGRPLPAWVAGVAFPRRSLVVLGPALSGAPKFGREVLFAHELSHVLLAKAVGFRVLPKWFVEGFADLQAMTPHLGDWRDISVGGALPLGELHRGLGHDGRRAAESYRQSYDFVRYLRGVGDGSAFRRFIALLGQGMAFDEALRMVFHVSPGELEAKWKQRWNWQNVIVPMITSGLFLWVLAALLLVLGYLRKRRSLRAAIAAMDGGREVSRAEPGLVGLGNGPEVENGEERLEPWMLQQDPDPDEPDPREEHPLLNLGVLLVATLVSLTLTAILAAIWPGTRIWILAAPAALLTFVALRWASKT